MIQWDSPHELYAYRLLDLDSGVQEFREQPCVIYYSMDGEGHRHYPDAFLRKGARSILLEVKTTREASKPEILSRTNLLTRHLPPFGYEYVVVMDDDLRREPRQKNCQLVLRLGRIPLALDAREFARKLFDAAPFLTWGDLKSGNFLPIGIEHCCRLVLEGVLRLDLDQQIGADTKFFKVLSGETTGVSIV
jgi:hypothetical protein